MQCERDWFDTYGERALDYFGRLHQPKVLTEENAWRKVYNRARWEDDTLPLYIERNMITGEERNIVDN